MPGFAGQRARSIRRSVHNLYEQATASRAKVHLAREQLSLKDQLEHDHLNQRQAQLSNLQQLGTNERQSNGPREQAAGRKLLSILHQTQIQHEQGTSLDLAKLKAERSQQLWVRLLTLLCSAGAAGAVVEIAGAALLHHHYTLVWQKGDDVVAFLCFHGLFQLVVFVLQGCQMDLNTFIKL